MPPAPASAQDHGPAPDPLAERVHRALRGRLGELEFTERTELFVLGVDSLLLLRILADLALDPTQEIDPQGLADVITVGDLRDFVAGWDTARAG